MKQTRNYTNEGGSNADCTQRRDSTLYGLDCADEEDHVSVRTTLVRLARERMGTSEWDGLRVT